jgi:RNA polymerase sigma-70 factor, ECF subfamily
MHEDETSQGARVSLIDDRFEETLVRLRAYIAARIGDDEAAADIAQDVILRSLASGALEQADNPVGWLYRSARNAVIDHYRTRRRLEPLDDRLELPADSLPDRDHPNDATRELGRCLQPLVSELSPIYRDAVTRVDLEGWTHQQAAAELGISVSGMKSRVQRGRSQLHELLTQCCAVRLDRTGGVAGYRPRPGGCGCSEAVPRSGDLADSAPEHSVVS